MIDIYTCVWDINYIYRYIRLWDTSWYNIIYPNLIWPYELQKPSHPDFIMVSPGSAPFHAAAGFTVFTGGKKRVPPEMAEKNRQTWWEDLALLGTGDEGCNQQTIGKKTTMNKNGFTWWIWFIPYNTYEHNTFLAGACFDFTIDSKDKSTS